jgi:outer membrane protein OmpA-like peptidoglycan-associated protein
MTMRLPTLLTAALAATAAHAQPATLNAPPARITDPAIHADYRTYEAVQARLKALNERGLSRGPRISDYHLSKAQCWLDVSFHEYSRNDRSAFPQQALDQAATLAALMEAGATPLPDDTPLVNDAPRIRPDLWAALAQVRSSPGARCAAQATACAEVELVHAGNELKQLGWRHANPYVQIAEDRVAEAQRAAQRCDPPAASLAAAPPPPVAPQEVTIRGAALFDFGASQAAGLRALSRERLDALVQRVTAPGFGVTRITIVGHADRLNASGRTGLNDALSLARARTVAEFFIAAGIDPAKISVEGRSDRVPVEICPGPFATPRDEQECLAPNRRVEIEVTGVRRGAEG